MPTRHMIITDDAATVTVSGGTEYERNTDNVEIEAINRDRIADKIKAAITVFEDHFSNWSSYTNADKDTAMRHTVRALAVLLREHARQYQSEGPS